MKAAYLIPFTLIAVTACQKPAEKAAESAASSGTAPAPVSQNGLTLSDAKLVLPAVTGHPGAAYFTLANDSDKDVTVAAISIADAGKAEMHLSTATGMEPIQSIDVPAKGFTVFAPGGRHVMVFDIASKLTAGATGEVTVTFADGDKLSAPLAVQAAGGDTEHMH